MATNDFAPDSYPALTNGDELSVARALYIYSGGPEREHERTEFWSSNSGAADANRQWWTKEARRFLFFLYDGEAEDAAQ